MNYLKFGEQLLYNYSTLTDSDKLKVLDAKTNFITSEFEELNNKWLLLDQQRNNPASVISPPMPLSSSSSVAITEDETLKGLFSSIVNLENKLAGQTASLTIPTTNVINLNNNMPTLKNRSDVCTLFDQLPEPNEQSFTQELINVPLDSKNSFEAPYLWCKCDENTDKAYSNTESCKAYDVCHRNYANNNRIDSKSTYTTIGTIDKQIYDYCTKAFINFPKYLQTNSDSSNSL